MKYCLFPCFKHKGIVANFGVNVKHSGLFNGKNAVQPD